MCPCHCTLCSASRQLGLSQAFGQVITVGTSSSGHVGAPAVVYAAVLAANCDTVILAPAVVVAAAAFAADLTDADLASDSVVSVATYVADLVATDLAPVILVVSCAVVPQPPPPPIVPPPKLFPQPSQFFPFASFAADLGDADLVTAAVVEIAAAFTTDLAADLDTDELSAVVRAAVIDFVSATAAVVSANAFAGNVTAVLPATAMVSDSAIAAVLSNTHLAASICFLQIQALAYYTGIMLKSQ